MRTGLILLLCLFASPLPACIWKTGTTARGKRIDVNDIIGEDKVQSLGGNIDRSIAAREKAKFESAPTADVEARNDYAVALLELGETGRAVEVLEALERDHPGAYATAANLGTAYELAGRDEAALQWIRESIKRDDDAHWGSEWLHVRILEAKLALANDPQWLATHSVTGIDVGTEVRPQIGRGLPRGNGGKTLQANDVKMALWYQLDERLSFIEPPDAIVGALFFDWGNLAFNTETLESAAAFYRASLRFGAPDPELAKARLKLAEQLLREYTPRGKKK